MYIIYTKLKGYLLICYSIFLIHHEWIRKFCRFRSKHIDAKSARKAMLLRMSRERGPAPLPVRQPPPPVPRAPPRTPPLKIGKRSAMGPPSFAAPPIPTKTRVRKLEEEVAGLKRMIGQLQRIVLNKH